MLGGMKVQKREMRRLQNRPDGRLLWEKLKWKIVIINKTAGHNKTSVRLNQNNMIKKTPYYWLLL